MSSPSPPAPFKSSPGSIAKIAWAISGKYTDGVEEKDTAQRTETSWKEIKDQLTSDKTLQIVLDLVLYRLPRYTDIPLTFGQIA